MGSGPSIPTGYQSGIQTGGNTTKSINKTHIIPEDSPSSGLDDESDLNRELCPNNDRNKQLSYANARNSYSTRGKYNGPYYVVEDMSVAEKGVCKLVVDGGTGTGFFCTFEAENETLHLLCTNNHVLNREILEKGYFYCTLHDGSRLEIAKSRFLWTSKKYDITFVELSHSERYALEVLKSARFFGLMKKAEDLINKEVSIYLCARDNPKCALSLGKVMEDNSKYIIYSNGADAGSSGSPVIVEGVVVGVHIGSLEKRNQRMALKMSFAHDLLQENFYSCARNNRVTYEMYKTYRTCCAATFVASINGDETQRKRGFVAEIEAAGRVVYGIFLAIKFDKIHCGTSLTLQCEFNDGKKIDLESHAGSARVNFAALVFLEVSQVLIKNTFGQLTKEIIPLIKPAQPHEDLYVGYIDGSFDTPRPLFGRENYQNHMEYCTFRRQEFVGSPIYSDSGHVVAVCDSTGKWYDTALNASFLAAKIAEASTYYFGVTEKQAQEQVPYRVHYGTDKTKKFSKYNSTEECHTNYVVGQRRYYQGYTNAAETEKQTEYDTTKDLDRLYRLK